jgi:GYF domain 2
MNSLTVEKTVYRPVTCERCGCAYGYHLSAKATGTIRQPHGLAGGFKRLIERDVHDQNLRDEAYGAVYRKLNATHRFVACPKCRWYQRKMSRTYGLRRLLWMHYGGIALLVSACASAFIAFMLLDSRYAVERQVASIGACVAALLALVGGGLLYLRYKRAGLYDLNANYPNHLAPFPGEPDGIICRPSNPYLQEGITDDLGGWYVARDGKRFGPYSWNQLYDLAFTGKLHGDDHVIAPDGPDWMEARSISELGLQ